MPVRFLLDEHLRGRPWHAMVRRRETTHPDLIVTRVGDPPDLPLGTADPEILLWAERNGYLLVSSDINSMPAHHARHLASGRHRHGVLLVPPAHELGDVVGHLILVH